MGGPWSRSHKVVIWNRERRDGGSARPIRPPRIRERRVRDQIEARGKRMMTAVLSYAFDARES
jgi:hypothetical protein